VDEDGGVLGDDLSDLLGHLEARATALLGGEAVILEVEVEHDAAVDLVLVALEDAERDTLDEAVLVADVWRLPLVEELGPGQVVLDDEDQGTGIGKLGSVG
jgi:hypothetical protein